LTQADVPAASSGVVLVAPCGLVTAQDGKKLTVTQFDAGRFSEEGTAAAAAEERVDLVE
jgi:hypothetical protein